MKIKNYNSFNESLNNLPIELVSQPDGISCGPTCLKMISNSFKINVTIEELKIVCGTDHLTGTTDLKMIKGLDYLNFDWEQFPLKDKNIAFKKLSDAIDNKHYILFRTLMKGAKHWIVGNPNGDEYSILDPWLGEYTFNKEELDKVWGARDYDGFIIKGIKPIQGKAHIEKIQPEDKNEIINMASLVFTNVMSYRANKSYLSSPSVDWNNSAKLVLNNEIIGCYLISPGDIDQSEKGGVEGFALAIKPGYRKYGYGEMLKDWLENWAKENGYNYVWGHHLAGLNNREFWLKRRELYTSPNTYPNLSSNKGSFRTIKRLN